VSDRDLKLLASRSSPRDERVLRQAGTLQGEGQRMRVVDLPSSGQVEQHPMGLREICTANRPRGHGGTIRCAVDGCLLSMVRPGISFIRHARFPLRSRERCSCPHTLASGSSIDLGGYSLSRIMGRAARKTVEAFSERRNIAIAVLRTGRTVFSKTR
jgi:hypothetical protein